MTGGDTYDTLEGLENLSHIGGSYLYKNTEFYKFLGMEGLISIDGDFNFDFYTFSDAYNFDGFDNLTSIGGSFIMGSSFSPRDMDALSNLTNIGGDLRMESTETNVEGLQNLKTIGGSLIFRYYNFNSNLNGLEALNQVGGDINITYTDITDYCAIENLVLNGQYQSIIISNNVYNPTIEDFENGDCKQ